MGALICLLAANAFLVGATHEGRIEGTAIAWRSVLFSNFAELPADEITRVELAGGGALEIPRTDWVHDAGDRLVHVVVERRQEFDPDASGVRLEAPIAAGESVQRVRVVGIEGLKFLPDPALGIDQYIGYAMSRAVLKNERDQAARLYDERWDVGAIYLRADPELARIGLSGTIRSARARPSVVFAIAGAFAGTTAVLGFAYRALTRSVETDRSEAVIAAEISRMRRKAGRAG